MKAEMGLKFTQPIVLLVDESQVAFIDEDDYSKIRLYEIMMALLAFGRGLYGILLAVRKRVSR